MEEPKRVAHSSSQSVKLDTSKYLYIIEGCAKSQPFFYLNLILKLIANINARILRYLLNQTEKWGRNVRTRAFQRK